jgi:hypothetical protein
MAGHGWDQYKAGNLIVANNTLVKLSRGTYGGSRAARSRGEPRHSALELPGGLVLHLK